MRFAHYFCGFRQGVQLSPLGFAACQSKNCTNRTSGEEAPTECTEHTEPLAEKSLPQMTRMFTDVGGYGIPAIPTLPTQGVQLSPLGFAACQSKNCTNKTKGTYCSVGALIARLVHLRQVHPLEGSSV
mgnify:CR=1